MITDSFFGNKKIAIEVDEFGSWWIYSWYKLCWIDWLFNILFISYLLFIYVIGLLTDKIYWLNLIRKHIYWGDVSVPKGLYVFLIHKLPNFIFLISSPTNFPPGKMFVLVSTFRKSHFDIWQNFEVFSVVFLVKQIKTANLRLIFFVGYVILQVQMWHLFFTCSVLDLLFCRRGFHMLML